MADVAADAGAIFRPEGEKTRDSQQRDDGKRQEDFVDMLRRKKVARTSEQAQRRRRQ